MRIVLRNTTKRKDAVYIIVRDENGQLTGYWGRWDIYQNYGIFKLRSQVKSIELTRLLGQKCDKGYVPVEVVDAPGWVIAMLQRSGAPLGDDASNTQIQLREPESIQSNPGRNRVRKQSRAAALEL